jgi:hypothetical protein
MALLSAVGGDLPSGKNIPQGIMTKHPINITPYIVSCILFGVATSCAEFPKSPRSTECTLVVDAKMRLAAKSHQPYWILIFMA